MINEQIEADVVRLVNEDGAIEISTDEALKMAEEQGLDLICINNSGDIPVVKIDNYSSYMYNKNKKKKEQEKKARLNANDNKEIQIGASTAEHDLCIKARKIDQLLKKGARIKLVIKYRGRERSRINEGADKLQILASKVTEKYKVDVPAKIEGNQCIMVISTLR